MMVIGGMIRFLRRPHQIIRHELGRRGFDCGDGLFLKSPIFCRRIVQSVTKNRARTVVCKILVQVSAAAFDH